MENIDAVAALAALAQDNRLDVFRSLVQAGPEGMPAGQVAEALGLAPNTLTFHFDRLRGAGLVKVRREGRSMIYAAQYEAMNGLRGFLTENCCQGAAEKCAPSTCKPAKSKPVKVTAREEPAYEAHADCPRESLLRAAASRPHHRATGFDQAREFDRAGHCRPMNRSTFNRPDIWT